MKEEICDAEHYADLAIHYMETDKEAAELFYTLSKEEMVHMSKLHRMVSDMIAQYRKEHGDPPVEMLAVYNYLHYKSMKHASEVRSLQGMYSA